MTDGQIEERVVLVDDLDRELGSEEKISAHMDGGKLHRAFSIFVFDPQGRWLLQKRAAGKYHYAGLWTNTCCSHPRPGEVVEQAAHRRLKEELGFDCPLFERFSFIYRAGSKSGLIEYEFDHVLTGAYGGQVRPDPHEVEHVDWLKPEDLSVKLAEDPESFTPWFRLAFMRVSQISAL